MVRHPCSASRFACRALVLYAADGAEVHRPQLHDRHRGGAHDPRRRDVGAGQRDRGGARGARRGRATSSPSCSSPCWRSRPTPRPNTRARASSCAPCARDGRRGGRGGATWHRLSRHAPVRDVGGPARVVAPALPRADRGAALRRAPGDHLRPARPRRARRPRQGDPRGQRHARARADPARAGRQLAVLARRRHRLRLHADADLPRLPARRHPAVLRGLGRLRAPDRLHGRLGRDRGLHVPLVRRAAAPELRHRRDPGDGRADAGGAHAGARRAHPGDGQGAVRALRGRQAARPLPVPDARREQVAGRAARARGRARRPARSAGGSRPRSWRGGSTTACASTRRTSDRPPSSRRSPTSCSAATALSASAWSTRRTTTTAK